MESDYGYGLWSLVILDSAIFIFRAFSFWQPKTKRDWRAFGSFSAFIIALFTEMYGFPLTIYLLSGWLRKRFPKSNILSHDFGHLWNDLLGWKGDPHFNPIHIGSELLIFGGIWLLMFGFLLQWPMIVTGVMFPILTILYIRLAIAEERDSVGRFGATYVRYAEHVPRFVPRLGGSVRQYEVARPLGSV